MFLTNNRWWTDPFRLKESHQRVWPVYPVEGLKSNLEGPQELEELRGDKEPPREEGWGNAIEDLDYTPFTFSLWNVAVAQLFL